MYVTQSAEKLKIFIINEDFLKVPDKNRVGHKASVCVDFDERNV